MENQLLTSYKLQDTIWVVVKITQSFTFKNQQGFVQVFLVLLLVVGLGFSVYLAQQKTNFLPEAFGPRPNFSQLTADLSIDKAVFSFQFGGNTNYFRVDLSTRPDMSYELHQDFVTGTKSPLTRNNPYFQERFYRCDKTVYWKVYNADKTVSSSVQSAYIKCTPPPLVSTTVSLSSPKAKIFSGPMPKTIGSSGEVKVDLRQYDYNGNYAWIVISGKLKSLQPNKGYLLELCRQDGTSCNLDAGQSIRTDASGSAAFKDLAINPSNPPDNPLTYIKVIGDECNIQVPCLIGYYSIDPKQIPPVISQPVTGTLPPPQTR